jgi:dephospho-CoA kinase
MKMIGLTGGVACGKTTVALQFAEHGFPVIDTDLIVRELLEHNGGVRQWLQKEFGTTDRAEIRKIVFEDAEKRRSLEKLLHPKVEGIVQARVLELRAQSPVPRIAVVVVPLLFEANWQKFFGITVAVLSGPDKQVERLIARDGISADLARRMISAQMPNEEKARKAAFTVQNDGTLEALRMDVEKLLAGILERAQ